MESKSNSIQLCLRFDRNSFKNLDLTDFDCSVDELRNKTSEILKFSGRDFDFLYHGHRLRDGEKLGKYGIKPGSTVDVLMKPAIQQPQIEPVDMEKLKQLRRGVMMIIAQKPQRLILEQILKSREALENLMVATPGLDRDAFVMGMIQELDIFVLSATSEREAISKVVEEHPAFGHAALHLIATVSEEASKAQTDQQNTPASRDAYEIDRASDDENDEDDEEEDMELDGAGTSRNEAGAGNATGAPGVITADFFRQAMMMATGGTANPPAPLVTQAQLDQLRDMGITDEALARRALEQSGGDISLAIEMLFGDGMF